jgi:hypothetical protein
VSSDAGRRERTGLRPIQQATWATTQKPGKQLANLKHSQRRNYAVERDHSWGRFTCAPQIAPLCLVGSLLSVKVFLAD